MKNILHLIETSGPGGAEKMLISLVENLDRSRYRSLVCLLKDGWLKTQLLERGIETIVIPQHRSLDFSWIFRLARLLKDRSIHLMHAHEFAMNVYGSLLSRMTGIPIVATVHGKNYYWVKWRRRLAYRFVARQAMMAVVSEDLKRFLTQRVVIHPDNIRIVHNGVALHPHAESARHNILRKELGINGDQPIIGTVGNLYAVKGQTYLLRACAVVAKAFPNFVLLVAGRGQQFSVLEEEARCLGIGSNVKFLEFRSDVPSLLQAMDVFVLPSVSEGLPLSILEAMALGKPVVASDVGGIPEVVEDAAQAMGEIWEGRKLGTLSEVGFFSLGRGKAFSTVEGGVILTDRDDIAEKLKHHMESLSSYGSWDLLKLFLKAAALALFLHPLLFWIPRSMPFLKLGETLFEPHFPILRMSSFQAGLARNWRPRLQKLQDGRKKIVNRWIAALEGEGIPGLHSQIYQVFGLIRFPVKVSDVEKREFLLRQSARKGLGVMPAYPNSIDSLPELRGYMGARKFPVAESCARELVTLPTHNYVTQEDIMEITRLLCPRLACELCESS